MLVHFMGNFKRKCLLFSFVFVLLGCSIVPKESSITNSASGTESSDGEPLEIPSFEYENYQPGFTEVESKTLNSDEVPSSDRDIAIENDEDYDISYEKKKCTASYDDLCTMGVNNDILYPGAIVDITEGRYSSLYFKRAPLTISCNLESTIGDPKTLATTIENPNLSSVRTGIRTIVSQNLPGANSLPMNLSLDIREVSNENEFFMNLGFGLQIKKFALSEMFKTKNIKKQTNLMVILKQVFYTVDVDFKGVRGFIDDSVKTSEINENVKGTVPAYVSSVSYGRIAMISIQSNYSKQEITNALSASYGEMSEHPGTSATKKLGVEFDSTLKSISADSDTDIHFYVYGGDGTSSSALTAITSSSTSALSSIFGSFEASKSVGLPISYTMRHLQDKGNVTAKVQSCDEYVVKNVVYNPKKLMNWSYLDSLIKNGTLFTEQKITLDFSAMVDYSHPDEACTNADRTITIPDNVEDLFVLGPNRGTEEVVFNRLSFVVDYRDINNPLTIHLDSIGFNADPNKGHGICISSSSDSLLIIEISRRVGLTSSDGMPAIKAENLRIIGNGMLAIKGSSAAQYSSNTFPTVQVSNDLAIQITGGISVYGNNGMDGSSDQDVLDGKPSLKAERIAINVTSESHFYGGNGGTPSSKQQSSTTGGEGLEGLRGGDGSPAMVCSEITIESPNINIHSGDGGQGGQGGQGGDGKVEWGTGVYSGTGGIGGIGGNGGKAISGNVANQNAFIVNVFGGNGGKGGNGGNSSAIFITEFSSIQGAVLQNSSLLVPGDGGNGGLGGDKGYAHTSFGDQGTKYGQEGEPGTVGERGLC